jgi:Ca2+-binding RTX toxin-like protein
LFIDFGLSLPASGLPLSVNAPLVGPSLRDLAGPNTGPDLTSGKVTLPAAADLNLKPVSTDYDGNGVINNKDLLAFEKDVLAIVQRAYAPFDVKVVLVSSADVDDVKAFLAANKGDKSGQFDAYVFAGTFTSSFSTNPGHSVALGTGLIGKASGADRAAAANRSDEVAVAFADEIVASASGTAGSATWRKNLAHDMANVIGHEAAHTFGLSHTLSTDDHGRLANELLLTHGDLLRAAQEPVANQIFTRFKLTLDDLSGTVNEYDRLAKDPDGGLRDDNHNKVPDFAYVTGTGANDRIRLTNAGVDAAGRRIVKVFIDAYSDTARTHLIRSDSYTIVIGKDTEGLIRIDGGAGDDEITVDPTLTVETLIYGGDGDDTIQGGSGKDRIYGEEGNDFIQARGGNDTVRGGDGMDTIEGGSGDDSLFGDDAIDSIKGDDGNDLIVGGQGGDFLYGGAGNDKLLGESGTDTLNGGDGDDYLSGGQDDDTLNGGDGKDTLVGGPGEDTLNGGPKIDTIYNPGNQDVVITDDGEGPDHIIDKPTRQAAPHAAVTPAATTVAGNLSSDQAAALEAGLQQFLAWAGSVGGQLPVGDTTTGALLKDALERGLVQQTIAFLDSHPNAPVADVVAMLQGLSSLGLGDLVVSTSNVSATTGSTLRFDLHFQATLTTTTTLSNLGAADKGVVGSDASVPLTATVDFDFSFGLASGTFFVKLPAGINVRTTIDASDLAIPISVGLLDATTEDGLVSMDAQTTVTLADPSGDGTITADEMTAAGTRLAQGGSLYVELPFEAMLGSMSEAGAITVNHDDLADGQQANVVEVGGSGEVQQVAQLTPSAVLEYLKDLAGVLDRASASARLAATLPFTRGLKLGEVADLAAAFRTQILDRLVVTP